MQHPLERIPANLRARVFAPVLLATLVVAGAMAALDARLETPEVTHGIVSFEFAGTAERAGRMLDSWNEAARSAAGVSLGLDYVFLALYSTALGFGCLWARAPLGALRPWLAGLGVPLAWAQWLAALGDGIENYGLVRLLLDGPREEWALLAWRAATFKFLLVAAGIAYLLAGVVVRFRRRGTSWRTARGPAAP